MVDGFLIAKDLGPPLTLPLERQWLRGSATIVLKLEGFAFKPSQHVLYLTPSCLQWQRCV